MNIELGMRPPSSPCDIIPTRLSGEIMGAIRSNVLSIINSSLFWMCTRPFLRHSVFNCYSGSRGLESTDSKKKKKCKALLRSPQVAPEGDPEHSVALREKFLMLLETSRQCVNGLNRQASDMDGHTVSSSMLGSSAVMLQWNIRVYSLRLSRV